MRSRNLSLAIASLLFAAQASVADGIFEKTSLTAGFSVGQLDVNKDNFVSPILSPAGKRGFESNSTSWSLFVGLELNRYLSVELGWLDGGSPSQETLLATVLVPPLPATTVTQTDTFEIDKINSHGILGSAIGTWPINEMVSVYGRAGFFRWDATTRVERSDEVQNFAIGTFTRTFQYFKSSKSGNDPFLGLGLALNIDNALLRLEYDVSKINDADLRNISLSVMWRFKPWN